MSLFEGIRVKKGYFILLCVASLAAIILGVFAGVNFSGGALTINLNNISYIQFLKEECSFVSLIFKMLLGVGIFFLIILLCSSKSFLLPLGILFYLYFVYSQTVIFISLIMIYGFFNCVVLALLLLVYIVLIILVFILAMLEMFGLTNDSCYFKCCFTNQSKILIFLIMLVLLTIIFAIVIALLKSFVILLVF